MVEGKAKRLIGLPTDQASEQRMAWRLEFPALSQTQDARKRPKSRFN